MIITIIAIAAPPVSALSGLKDTISVVSADIHELQGVVKTLGSITSKFSIIIQAIGLPAIVLFAGIIFFSMALNVLGIPYGPLCFFSALAISNAIWMIIHLQFKQLDSSFIASILKTNGIILAPFILINMLKTFLPKLFSTVGGKLSYFFMKKKYSFPEKEKVIGLLKDYQSSSSNLYRSLISDLMKTEKNEVVLSSATKESIQSIQEILEGINSVKKQAE
jgi:hypothetical protein